MENPITIHDLGGPPLFLEIPISMATGGRDCIIPTIGDQKLTFEGCQNAKSGGNRFKRPPFGAHPK